MTTNEIEKQLKRKAEEQISDYARDIVDGLAMFGKDNTGINRSGLHWYSKRQKPHKKYTSDPEPEDPFCHYDWSELAQLIRRNMEHNLLDQMVERKAKELLSKIDLLG
tara:strand:+ start:763 stop:1086 length:324 start_codon:yes stop_codon:yes gene_type:complete